MLTRILNFFRYWLSSYSRQFITCPECQRRFLRVDSHFGFCSESCAQENQDRTAL